ncbi:hypothetical protein BQ8482_570005 [Mesorhizobium delmotii]|uniref:Uncharacterized protein n=1 Tax=Mesorhizobium delmotii TaxID=1631247 RepID=A0A2P9AUZ4_9HYPH|nr:hypothetical protein BQ8482_570005 [Mesorhizobium delmotii]
MLDARRESNGLGHSDFKFAIRQRILTSAAALRTLRHFSGMNSTPAFVCCDMLGSERY